MPDTEEKIESDAHVAMPRGDVFAGVHAIKGSIMNAGQRFAVYDRTEYPEEGGIYVWYKGMPYPKKGFPFPEAIFQNDITKRIFMTMLKSVVLKEMAFLGFGFMLLPWKRKVRIIESILGGMGRISQWTLSICFLKPERYSNASRSIYKTLSNFFVHLGINEGTDEQGIKIISRMVATMIEYDDAYRFRICDIGSEVNWIALKARPIREVRRLSKIYTEREKIPAVAAIKSAVLLLTVALLHPKVRRAFKKTITDMDFMDRRWFILDNSDRYHTLLRGDYNFTGRRFEERFEIYKDTHRVSKCCEVKVSKRDDILPPDWICSKCKNFCQVGFILPPEMTIAPEENESQK